MSLSKYESTGETTNQARIARIILEPCADLLRDVLRKEISPFTLSQKVKTYAANLPKHKKIEINKNQEQIVYGKNYSEFDITLLYFSLRNMCSLPTPQKGWGKDPSPGDKSVSANIERIRMIRNDYGHIKHCRISESDFKKKMERHFSNCYGSGGIPWKL